MNKGVNSTTIVTNQKCTKETKINNKVVCTEYGLSPTKLNITGNDVKISGTYYINGNVTMGAENKTTNIKSNAILYVDGDVEIRFSKLTGINENSSLIIFATGEIFISNISENQDIPSEIKGFFYSQKDMTIYGVGSNIEIIGGLSAKNIFLTALRGKHLTAATSVDQQPSKKSRLQVIYDENIINQYTQFKRDQEEEFIKQIDDPKVLERY